MEGYCSTGQSPQGAVVPMEEEEKVVFIYFTKISWCVIFRLYIPGITRKGWGSPGD
jgi:hypothetical protein